MSLEVILRQFILQRDTRNTFTDPDSLIYQLKDGVELRGILSGSTRSQNAGRTYRTPVQRQSSLFIPVSPSPLVKGQLCRPETTAGGPPSHGPSRWPANLGS